MVFNVTFNNISIISWWSVFLVEETEVPGENHQPVKSHWQILAHNVVSGTPHLSGIRTLNFMVKGTDCIGSHKSKCHAITTTTALHPYIVSKVFARIEMNIFFNVEDTKG
jgi:hypothetical protein